MGRYQGPGLEYAGAGNPYEPGVDYIRGPGRTISGIPDITRRLAFLPFDEAATFCIQQISHHLCQILSMPPGSTLDKKMTSSTTALFCKDQGHFSPAFPTAIWYNCQRQRAVRPEQTRKKNIQDYDHHHTSWRASACALMIWRGLQNLLLYLHHGYIRQSGGDTNLD